MWDHHRGDSAPQSAGMNCVREDKPRFDSMCDLTSPQYTHTFICTHKIAPSLPDSLLFLLRSPTLSSCSHLVFLFYCLPSPHSISHPPHTFLHPSSLPANWHSSTRHTVCSTYLTPSPPYLWLTSVTISSHRFEGECRDAQNGTHTEEDSESSGTQIQQISYYFSGSRSFSRSEDTGENIDGDSSDVRDDQDVLT